MFRDPPPTAVVPPIPSQHGNIRNAFDSRRFIVNCDET